MTQRYAHKPMRALGEQLLAVLEPTLIRGVIAGSLRRGAESVKDIELVVEPRLERRVVDLFGTTEEVAALDELVERLREQGMLRPRLDSRGRAAWGPRYRRALFCGAALDLFVCRPPAQWGVILALRTGPAEFSRKLVTQQRFGGLLPNYWSVRDGGLYDEQGELRPTPEEGDFFALLGVDYIEPRARQ